MYVCNANYNGRTDGLGKGAAVAQAVDDMEGNECDSAVDADSEQLATAHCHMQQH